MRLFKLSGQVEAEPSGGKVYSKVINQVLKPCGMEEVEEGGGRSEEWGEMGYEGSTGYTEFEYGIGSMKSN